ncbi:MAG: type II toxin-antitoxin system Phd/YefM family antitoxin [Spirochaetaceae bacterium]|nr:type II toxin-antitoxin system Phd/YefM family antitoxin [Spirochaetaceae bacterium]
METISITNLKAHLSSELKKVQKGKRIQVLEHKRPVAILIPSDTEELFVCLAEKKYSYQAVLPLTDKDPLIELEDERSDRW